MKRLFREGFKMLLQKSIFPLIYNINRKKPVRKNLVIFADAHHDRLPEYMESLYAELKMRGMHVMSYTFDISGLSSGEGFRRMTAFMKLYAVSNYVILCNNFLPVSSCRKKKETKVIQLWHACGALKKFGYDAVDDIPGWYRGNVYKNYDIVTVSGPGAVEPFQSAMRIKKKGIVRAIGVSGTDRLLNEEYKNNIYTKFRHNYPDAEGKKIILWAPTFRGAAGDAASAGSKADLYGEAALEELQKCKDYYVIKSLHPHMTDTPSNMTTEEIMICSDIVISDYSSLIYQAVLLKKPIVYYAPDLKSYEMQRGFYTDYSTLPGIHMNSGESLKQAVDRALSSNDIYDNSSSNEFMMNYMSGCDGHATQRIADIILQNDFTGD